MNSPQIEADERSAASVVPEKDEDMQVEEAQLEEAVTENGQAVVEKVVVDSDAVPEDESMGPFESFFIDPRNVPENKRLPYIMMLYGAMGWDIDEIFPYSEILNDTTNSIGGGGWKRSLRPTKEMIAGEILRQHPNAKLNIKNIKIDEFILRVHPLTDPRDIAFLYTEERNIRKKFYELLNADFSQDAIINKDVVAKSRNIIPVSTHPPGGRKSGGNRFQANDEKILSLYKFTPKNKKQKTLGQSPLPQSTTSSGLFPTTYTLSAQAAEQTMHAAIKFAELQQNSWNVTVILVDTSGVPVAAKRMDGAPPASYDIALGRAKNATRFHMNTSEIKGKLQNSTATSLEYQSGGCPIFIGDSKTCIGAIGVSGTSTSANDEQIARYGVSYITNLFSPSLPMP